MSKRVRNSVQNVSQNVQDEQPEYIEISEKINDFGDKLLAPITAKLKKKGWIFEPMRQFLEKVSKDGFESKPVVVLEIYIYEVDETYVLYHAEKDFVCVGTNVNQIVSRVAFGKNKAIYVKFNKLKENGRHKIKVGKSKSTINRMTYTFDPEAIDLFEVDLLKVNSRDYKHFKRKIEQDVKLPYKLHISFRNSQSDSADVDERWNTQEAISDKYNKHLDKFLSTTQEPSISTHNEDVETETDMTHEVIFDAILESVYDLKDLYCQLFNNLRLCFVKASDVNVTKREAIYTFDGNDYCLGCYRYTDETFVVSLSNSEYRQKMKNFVAGEHINYDSAKLKDKTGEANVTPDGCYYRIGTLDSVSTADKNFVTKDLSLDNQVLNLKDVSDPLRSFYGFVDKLKVNLGWKTLKVAKPFGDNDTECLKASVTDPYLKINDLGYIDYISMLKYICRFNPKVYKIILKNIDQSKIKRLCKMALENNEDYTLLDWANDHWWEIVETESLDEVEISNAPDCLAKLIMDSDKKKYEQDLSDLNKCFKIKNFVSLITVLGKLGTKLNDDFENLSCKIEDTPAITIDLFKESTKEAIMDYKMENPKFHEENFKWYIKTYLLSHLMWKDSNSVYDFFDWVDENLMLIYEINSNSKIDDYIRVCGSEKIEFAQKLQTSIIQFFSFKTNFRENSGYDKLFAKLACI